MPDSYPLRLAVLRVLVLSLLLTLGARLYYLQVLDDDKLVQTANRQHTREVILAAPRGTVVDDRGRPLVTSVSPRCGSVSRWVPIRVPRLSIVTYRTPSVPRRSAS